MDIIICGPAASGKTTLANNLESKMKRTIVYDGMRDKEDLLFTANAQHNIFNVRIFCVQFSDITKDEFSNPETFIIHLK
jgi:deoxyadenosine/deoxycytidine kinase